MKIHVVNAFVSDGRDSGNPAAVCVLEEDIPDEDKQEVARLAGLSETAFLLEKEGLFGLRWFTPKVEVDLCGHATLASAHVLWETGLLPERDEARFFTKSGILTATRSEGLVEMDFPVLEPRPVDVPEELLAAIDRKPLYVGRNEFDHVALYESERVVRDAVPKLERVTKLGSRGLVITARSDSPRYDFVSRFFAPNAGIGEDPVTGSAHCCLCPFWSSRLGKKRLVGYQASERGGVVHVKLVGDRVFLAGRAVTVNGREISLS